MDLSSEDHQFAADWLQDHCRAQPPDDTSLVWYVTASTLYTGVVNAAYAANRRPISFNDLWGVLQIIFPNVRPTKLHQVPVYSGLQYHPNGLNSGVKFG